MLQALPTTDELNFNAIPIQAGLGGDPWKIILACTLLRRTRRHCMQSVLQEILAKWPTPERLAEADQRDLEDVLYPLGLQCTRARQLQRLASMYMTDAWEDILELPGVGPYTADAVGLICFGDLDLATDDPALQKHRQNLQNQLDDCRPLLRS